MNEGKAFYFVRHGQTDHHRDQDSISLNQKGIQQAMDFRPWLKNLTFSDVLCSPLQRARETCRILLEHSDKKEIYSHNLRECTTAVWKSMTDPSDTRNTPEAEAFREQVRAAFVEIAAFSGTPLIVAHGGIHFALCELLQIKNHAKYIDNCQLAYFTFTGRHWSAHFPDLSLR